MTTDDSAGVALGLIAFLSFAALYIWTALALSAVFRKCGEAGWKAWVPILNQIVLLQLGRLSPLLFLLVLVPFAGPVILWVVLVVACYRINLAFGYGVGMTVLAALAVPVWASVLGFGPARWLGAESSARGVSASGPRRTGIADVGIDDGTGFVPRAVPTGHGASDDLAWTPPPPPVPPVSAPAQARALADTAPPTYDMVPPASGTVPPAYDTVPAVPGTVSPQSDPVPSASDPVPAPVAGRSSFAPDEPASRSWGGFDLGAVSEVTSEVTGPDSAAPAPISAVPLRSAAPPVSLPVTREDPRDPSPRSDVPRAPAAPHHAGPVGAPPPVTRVPPVPEVPAELEPEPWAPARSPIAEAEAFPDTSGHVSAVAGAARAGTPRSARSTVSAQHTKAEIPDDPLDQTIITRRRRTVWSLVVPSGSVVPITSDVVLLGRKPVADRAQPSAQLIPIDDGTVSKTHARLVLRDERWYITDLGSTNGVLFATLMGTEVEATPGEETEAGERFFLGDAEVRLQRTDG
jgi:hypothetical protein